jgi:uncharacterized membrane protein YdcZ (DUF606 family)
MKLILTALAVVAGAAVAFQGATNQGLQKPAGIGPALIVNTIVVLIGAMILWVATGAKTTFLPRRRLLATLPGRRFWVHHYRRGRPCLSETRRRLRHRPHGLRTVPRGHHHRSLRLDGHREESRYLQRMIGVMLVVAGVAVFRLSGSAASTP